MRARASTSALMSARSPASYSSSIICSSVGRSLLVGGIAISPYIRFRFHSSKVISSKFDPISRYFSAKSQICKLSTGIWHGISRLSKVPVQHPAHRTGDCTFHPPPPRHVLAFYYFVSRSAGGNHLFGG